MITKPYKRVYRPLVNGKFEDYLYLEDRRNCSERANLVRFYKIFEKNLKDIFEYVEPINKNKNTFSLKIYQLLCSVCMEIENNFKGFMTENGCASQNMNMTYYFKANKILKLNLFSVTLNINNQTKKYRPFKDWSSNSYKSLKWYQAYNNSKHNRKDFFQDANLNNLIDALAGLFIILYAQFNAFGQFEDFSGTTIHFEDYPENYNSIHLMPLSETSIFTIEKRPKFRKNEIYDFDWNVLKNDISPYQNIIL